MSLIEVRIILKNYCGTQILSLLPGIGGRGHRGQCHGPGRGISWRSRGAYP